MAYVIKRLLHTLPYFFFNNCFIKWRKLAPWVEVNASLKSVRTGYSQTCRVTLTFFAVILI